ncbi:MAG TPA: NYN domain-containing protein [Patescibacteria group bacterium]|nr:NYN domain-containing protein [Patescibacteria group bacterium]
MQKLKTCAFIDGSNIYFAQKKINIWLDWGKVKLYLEKKYDIKAIRYYIGIRKNDRTSQTFLKKLEKIRFTIIKKPVKIITNEFGKKIEKANFDVEITADIMTSLKKIDAVVLFSGDSDFAYLAELLNRQKKQIFVYSSKKTLSWELKLSAHRYFFIDNLSLLTKRRRFIRI